MSKFRLDEVDHQILDIVDRQHYNPFYRYSQEIVDFCRYRARKGKEDGRCRNNYGVFIGS